MDNVSLCAPLSACPNLLDLEIVGLHVELRPTLMSVSTSCHLIKHLFFESSKTGRDDSLKSPICVGLVNSCPNLTSLSLRGFKLHDYKVQILLQGLHKLKYVDFSTSYSITGTFLRNLGSSTGGNLLEVLILRDCMHLKEVEVAWFLTAVLAGDFKDLRHLDTSNREGLASEGDWYSRCYNLSIIPLKQVSEARPNICLLAEFPTEGSFVDIEHILYNDINSEVSLSSHSSNHTSDGSLLMLSSESSYNSDQGSGSEEFRDPIGDDDEGEEGGDQGIRPSHRAPSWMTSQGTMQSLRQMETMNANCTELRDTMNAIDAKIEGLYGTMNE